MTTANLATRSQLLSRLREIVPDASSDSVVMEVGHNGREVVLNFGTAETWVTFTPKQALALAQKLAVHAGLVDAVAKADGRS